MLGMKLPKPRVQLDRFELGVVFSLFLLMGGMMFTLGVLVGHGLGSREGGAHLTAATKEAVHGVEDATEHGHDRAPASVPKAADAAPGSSLKKAFRESKQQALVDLALREDDTSRPKSVIDAEAHANSHPEWSRKPASEDPVRDELVADYQRAKKNQDDRDKAGVPTAVKGLFERKSTVKDSFSPRSGSYTIQIASYATVDESDAKVSELRRSGFNEAYAESVRTKAGEKWFRVGVGAFPSPDWARKTGDKLMRRHLAGDYVVRQVP